MRLIWLFLFLAVSVSAQQTLEVKIDSIITDNSNPAERKFTINYRLSNHSDSPISFFLRPEGLISTKTGSLSNCPFYKIYEGDKFMDLGPVFERAGKGPEGSRIKFHPTDEDKNSEIAKQLKYYYDLPDSLIAAYKKDGYLSSLDFKPRKLMEDMFTLQPGETKTFRKFAYWDKDKYFLNDQNEFYLDGNSKHYIEITLILIKDHFKDRLTEEEYAAIMANEHFLKGVYVSNKAEIDFN